MPKAAVLQISMGVVLVATGVSAAGLTKRRDTKLPAKITMTHVIIHNELKVQPKKV